MFVMSFRLTSGPMVYAQSVLCFCIDLCDVDSSLCFFAFVSFGLRNNHPNGGSDAIVTDRYFKTCIMLFCAVTSVEIFVTKLFLSATSHFFRRNASKIVLKNFLL